MGKLIKNHWARLIVLTASVYQVLAGIHGFFWPKIFWDFLTKNLDGAVKPFPVLQIINLLLGIIAFAWEWPLAPVVKMLPGLHRSMEARLVVYPLCALAGAILYQGTNAAIYYLVGVIVYFWAYSEGEVRQFLLLGLIRIAANIPHRLYVRNRGLYRRGLVQDLAKYDERRNYV